MDSNMFHSLNSLALQLWALRHPQSLHYNILKIPELPARDDQNQQHAKKRQRRAKRPDGVVEEIELSVKHEVVGVRFTADVVALIVVAERGEHDEGADERD